MLPTTAFWLILILFTLWLYITYTAWQLAPKVKSRELLYLGLALWPLALVDSIVRLAGVSEWFSVAGVFHFIPIIVAAFLLHHVQRNTQPHLPVALWFTGLIIVLTVASEVPLLLKDASVSDWFFETPSGNAIKLWWFYLPYLVTCSGMCIISGQLVELCKRYHRYLPWQAVDIQRYKAQNLSSLAVLMLLVSIVCLFLVLLAASEKLSLSLWPLVIDLALSFMLLVSLWSAILSTQLLPSPLAYKRIYAASVNNTGRDKNIIAKSDQAMIDKKSYKVIGMTLSEFAQNAQVDPTDLLLALKRANKQDFRAYIFHYRMEYARNVVMRSDTSIAKVAQRLGFHTEKFLSGPFLAYLEKRE